MLTIKNTHNLLGKVFKSNGIGWAVTHVKECIDPALYIITIENYDNSIYYKFELTRREHMLAGEYWIQTIDKFNNMVDVNSIRFDNIRTRDGMLVELKFIMDKLNK
jgi:hypothetical protein